MEKIGKAIWQFFEQMAKAIVVWFLRLWKKSLNEQLWDKWMQFVKFCIVGLSNFFISYVVYAVALGVGLHWLWGSILGFVLSVLNAFYWNNKYVFQKGEKEQRLWWKALLKTYVSYAFSGLLLANMLLFLWNDILQLPELLGPVLNLVITTPLNFVVNKLWAFKTKK